MHARGGTSVIQNARRFEVDAAHGWARSPEHDCHLPELRLKNPRWASCHDESWQRELLVRRLKVQPAACQLHLIEYAVSGACCSQCLGRVGRVVQIRADFGELTRRESLSLFCRPSPIRLP
jgi:hypothetical protein